jgi:hypothetical protein
MEMTVADLPKKTVSDVKNYWNTSRRKQLMLKMGMNVVTHMLTSNALNLVDGKQFNDFNDLSHKMAMNVVTYMPTSDPLNLVHAQQFNDFNDLSHKMGMNLVTHMPTTDPLNL